MCDLHSLKNVKNTYGGMLHFVKLYAETLSFTESTNSPWVLFTFFKLYKWYQIARSSTYGDFRPTFFDFMNSRFTSLLEKCPYSDLLTMLKQQPCLKFLLIIFCADLYAEKLGLFVAKTNSDNENCDFHYIQFPLVLNINN